MKKSTPHGRRLKRLGINPATDTVISNAWVNAIQRCRTYTAEPIAGARVAGSLSAAHAILLHVREALDDLLHHRVAPDNKRPYEELAGAIDVAHIRALQIQPDTDNPAHRPLLEAKAVMYRLRQRWERLHQWGLAGPDRPVLVAAIDIYEEILRASSPKLMNAAELMRVDHLKRGHFWKPEGSDAGHTTTEGATT
jgi:hypothetical protein